GLKGELTFPGKSGDIIQKHGQIISRQFIKSKVPKGHISWANRQMAQAIPTSTIIRQSNIETAFCQFQRHVWTNFRGILDDILRADDKVSRRAQHAWCQQHRSGARVRYAMHLHNVSLVGDERMDFTWQALSLDALTLKLNK